MTTYLHIPHCRADARIIHGHRLPISRYRDKLFATYRGQIAVVKIIDFFTTPAFLSPSKSRKSQATKYTAFKTNSALNKHRISKNQWTANSLSFGAERSGNYGVYYCKIRTCSDIRGCPHYAWWRRASRRGPSGVVCLDKWAMRRDYSRLQA